MILCGHQQFLWYLDEYQNYFPWTVISMAVMITTSSESISFWYYINLFEKVMLHIFILSYIITEAHKHVNDVILFVWPLWTVTISSFLFFTIFFLLIGIINFIYLSWLPNIHICSEMLEAFFFPIVYFTFQPS